MGHKTDFMQDKYEYQEWKAVINLVRELIDRSLNSYDDYDGIQFVDVGASGIQVRLFNKKLKHSVPSEQPTIKYDFSNAQEVVKEMIEILEDTDNPEYIEQQNEFMEAGFKYGWD